MGQLILYRPHLEEAASRVQMLPFDGLFADFLSEEFPEGPEGAAHCLTLNGLRIEPEDYGSVALGEGDKAVFTVTPAGFEVIAAIVSVVAVVASVALSFLLAPEIPTVNGESERGSVYSVGVQANEARLGDVLPVSYGRVTRTPEYASQSWRRFRNNQEVRHFLLCLGGGDYAVEAVRIGDALASELPDGLVEFKAYRPGEHENRLGVIAADFDTHENVSTSQNVSDQELLDQQKFSEIVDGTFSGNTLTLTGANSSPPVAVGDVLQILRSSNAGVYTVTAVDDRKITVNNSFPRAVTENFDLNINAINSHIIGPFPASPPGTRTRRIELDIEWPQGLHNRDDRGDILEYSVQYQATLRQIDDDGVPFGATIRRTFDFSAGTVRHLRETFVIDGLAASRWQVSLARSDFQVPDREVTLSRWTGLKGFIDYDAGADVYGNTTLLAIKIVGAEQTSAASGRRISVTYNRLIQPLEGGALEASSNLADVLADMVRDPIHGARQGDDALEMISLAEFKSKTAGRSGFNGVFDTGGTLWEAMKDVARLGYGLPIPRGSAIGVAIDEAKPARRSIVTPDLILPGSFTTSFKSKGRGESDGVLIEYRDARTFEPREALFPPGAVSPRNVRMRGLVNTPEAEEFAKFFYEQELAQSAAFEWGMEWDALDFTTFDRVGAVVPFMDWANAYAVERAEVDRWILHLDRGPVPLGECWVQMRTPEGEASKLVQALADGDRTLKLAEPIPVDLVLPGEGVATIVAFGTEDEMMLDVLIDEVSPSGGATQVTAKPYVPSLYQGRIA